MFMAEHCGLAEIVEFVSRMINGRDPNLHNHHERVGALCSRYAKHVHMDDASGEMLTFAGRLHDIGKQGINLAIIDKVTPLTDNEHHSIRRHTTYGVYYAEPLSLPAPVVDAIHYHHENFDGTGYHGLKGDEIPEFARIIRVADSIDAIAHARAYKSVQHSTEEIIESLRARAAEYDERVRAVFNEILSDGRKR